jgi:viroplasmin and RNaseH domain-containing protein
MGVVEVKVSVCRVEGYGGEAFRGFFGMESGLGYMGGKKFCRTSESL